jgi:hypothetical protein
MEDSQVVTPGPAPGEAAVPTGKLLIGDPDDERLIPFWNLASRIWINTLRLPFLLVAYTFGKIATQAEYKCVRVQRSVRHPHSGLQTVITESSLP